MNFIKKNNYILYSILIILSFFVLCTNLLYTENSNINVLTDGWKLYINNTLIDENFNIEEDKFETLKKGDEIIIVRELQNIEYIEPEMQIYSNYTTIEVFLDNNKIYQYGIKEYENNIMLNNGNKFFKVNYNNEKTMTIKMIASESGIISNLKEIQIGERSNIISNFIRSNLIKIAVSGFTSFLAIALLLLFIKFKTINHETKKIFFISLYSLIIGIWTIVDSGITILFVEDTVLIKYIEYICLYTAPLPVYGFLLNTKNDSGKNIINKKITATIIMINVIFNIIAFSLFIFNIVHIKQTLPLFQIILTLSTSFLIACLIKNMKKESTQYINILYGIIFMIIATIIDIIVFNMKIFGINFKDIISNNLTTIGVTFLLLTMIYSFYKEMLITIKKSSQMEVYNKLAYTDSLTNLKNRAWYEDYIQNLINKNYTMISIDLNDLKVTNDTKGHDKGDELIKTFANILKESFDVDAHSVRFGGDEFLVILEYIDNKKMESALQQMNEKIKVTNSTKDIKVSASYGVAFSTENVKLKPAEIYKMADQRMYKMKKTIKQKK